MGILWVEHKVSICYLCNIHDELDLLALLVESNEAYQCYAITVDISECAKNHLLHMARVQTGPENMRLEKHLKLKYTHRHYTSLAHRRLYTCVSL